MSRRRWALPALFMGLVSPQAAGAADRVQECIAQHVEAQLLRKQSRWIAARDRLLECSRPTCPALVREECTALTRELESALPSIVLAAIGSDGQPTSEPFVSIDGAPERIPIDGRPVVLDPGEHQLSFRHPDDGTREVRIVLVESEQGRRVLADFRPLDAGPSGAGARRWPSRVMLVSGGVAAVALGSFTYFALSGRSVENELSRCQPYCDNRADIDRMRSRYLIADISLGVALVSLGVGAYAWTQHPSAPSSASAPGASRRGVSLHPVATLRGGALGSAGLWATGEF